MGLGRELISKIKNKKELKEDGGDERGRVVIY
jgi:hypothetical protein